MMPRQIFHIPYVKDLSKRLRRSPYLRKVFGYRDKTPFEDQFSQMRSSSQRRASGSSRPGSGKRQS